MPKFPPVLRLAIGLIMLTVSLLLVGDLLGLTPDENRAELAARKSIAETLAVQVSTSVSERHVAAVGKIMQALYKRNPNILSVGLRQGDGRLLASAGDHLRHWSSADQEKSTPTHVQVPIHDGKNRWGTVEVRFKPLHSTLTGLLRGGSFASTILFVAVTGLAAYWLFLRRSLRELDPSAVIPGRVREALDVLAEGLVIIDREERIVFANAAFETRLGKSFERFMGTRLSALGWEHMDNADVEQVRKKPWQPLLEGNAAPTVVQLQLRTALNERYLFAVKVAPIREASGDLRGVVVTFDDVTELQRKNTDLERALDRLKDSQSEITRQNRELQLLATRDPLTNALNRRSLFEGMSLLMEDATREGTMLSCVMVDIDHFKSINDRFGHATGDKVIKLLANILTEKSRAEDLVGRYGGEEFCVAIPGVDERGASRIAERMRIAVHEGETAKFTSALRISASFGVACTDCSETLAPSALVDRADKALYVAKQSGRNRVICWSNRTNVDTESSSATASTDPPAPIATQAPSEDPRVEVAQLQGRIAVLEGLLSEFREKTAHDELSETPGHIVLFDRINQGIVRSRRFGSRLALLAVDVETAQVVASAIGHAAGGKLTEMAAARLKEVLRSTDTIAPRDTDGVALSVSRLREGEFVILLADMNTAESATWIVQRVFSTLRKPLMLEGNEVFLKTNIGVSVYPEDGADPDALITHAKIALHEARAMAQRDTCLFYSKDMNRRSQQQLQLEAQLHRALEREEFYLEYQPSVDMQSGKITAFEALVRWRNTELGLIRPDVFIPIAEHADLIDDIGDWVLRSACRQLRYWLEAGYGQLSVAVNFSAKQFRRLDLIERVASLVNKESVPPESLIVEITESALMQNLDTAVTIADGLDRAGLRIALDDFGTGYSSLTYLQRFPIKVVKIDRSFLGDFPRDVRDTAIVSSVIAMAHGLGLRVVAEGVENENQLRTLSDLQCDEIQGYLFSRPISREEATALLAHPAEIRRMVKAVVPIDSTASPLAGVLNRLPARAFLG